MDDNHLDARLRAIHFVQTNLRMIAALLVVRKHPGALVRRNLDSPLDLFRSDYLIDVMNFVAQVSRQDATTTGQAG
jgi:hypothetical protein